VSKDWIIAYDGKSQSDDKALWTEKDFGDVTVMVDWRRNATNGADPLPIRFAGVELPDEARNSVLRALPPKTGKPEWRRAVLTKRRGRLTLAIDGETVFQDVAAGGAGARARLGLRHDGTPIEFANIFVKDRE
jgi:hypothetical protein